MDIRKMVDINSPAVLDMQMQQERQYQAALYGAGLPRRERDKLIQASRNRYRQLEQAYTDWVFADGYICGGSADA